MYKKNIFFDFFYSLLTFNNGFNNANNSKRIRKIAQRITKNKQRNISKWLFQLDLFQSFTQVFIKQIYFFSIFIAIIFKSKE